MKQPNAIDYLVDWLKTPLTTLGLKLQNLECAGVEPETVQAALRDHAELTKCINTLLSMLREDEELWMEAESRQRERPPAILLVDHNTMLLKTYSDYLSERGLQADAFYDGGRAVKAAHIRRYACAVLDVQMPGMDGREICRALRAFTDMPVIFLSSSLYRCQAEVDDLMGERDAYLEKPCESETLHSQILFCLGQAREPPKPTSDFVMDWEMRKLRLKDHTTALSPREAAMLRLLTERPGQDVTVAELQAVCPGEPSGEFGVIRDIITIQRKTAFASPRLGRVSRRRGGTVRLEPPEESI